MLNPLLPIYSRYNLLKKAENEHIKRIKDAAKGCGCDRHLFGLKLLHEQTIGGKLPEIFLDTSYKKSLHHSLSTSNAPGLATFGGFGNTVEDGYGCAYFLKPHRIDISIASSKVCSKTDCEKFGCAIVQALKSILEVLKSN